MQKQIIKRMSKRVALLKDKGMYYYVYVHLIICILSRYSLKRPRNSEVEKYLDKVFDEIFNKEINEEKIVEKFSEI